MTNKTIEDMCRELDGIALECGKNSHVAYSVAKCKESLLDLRVELAKYVQHCLDDEDLVTMTVADQK
jgi:hypothetical protein